MTILVIGGTGFIGSRLVRLLAARGEEIACMDINPGAHSFADLGKQVTVTRGDVMQFDDVMAATLGAKPSRVINLSYLLGSEHAPHFGESAVTEDDFRHGDYQYAVHKIFNEWQAKDYADKYGMSITAVRPANV